MRIILLWFWVESCRIQAINYINLIRNFWDSPHTYFTQLKPSITMLGFSILIVIIYWFGKERRKQWIFKHKNFQTHNLLKDKYYICATFNPCGDKPLNLEGLWGSFGSYYYVSGHTQNLHTGQRFGHYGQIVHTTFWHVISKSQWSYYMEAS